MKIKDIEQTIVKVGICEYGIKQYRVFICASDIFYGTGDYEDDEEICNDIEMDCYAVWLEDIINKGSINAGRGYYKTFAEAVNAAETSTGFIKWIQ